MKLFYGLFCLLFLTTKSDHVFWQAFGNRFINNDLDPVATWPKLEFTKVTIVFLIYFNYAYCKISQLSALEEDNKFLIVAQEIATKNKSSIYLWSMIETTKLNVPISTPSRFAVEKDYLVLVCLDRGLLLHLLSKV